MKALKFKQCFKSWSSGNTADMMGTLKIKCSITTGGGPFTGGPCVSVSFQTKKKKNKNKNQSHDLFDAVSLETASASLLLHLACGAVAHPAAVGVSSGGRELHVLLVDPWGNTRAELTRALASPELGPCRTAFSAPQGTGSPVTTRSRRHPHPPTAPHRSLPGHKASSHSSFGKTEQTEAFDSSLLGFAFPRRKNWPTVKSGRFVRPKINNCH